jgi:hypothetical protein
LLTLAYLIARVSAPQTTSISGSALVHWWLRPGKPYAQCGATGVQLLAAEATLSRTALAYRGVNDNHHVAGKDMIVGFSVCRFLGSKQKASIHNKSLCVPLCVRGNSSLPRLPVVHFPCRAIQPFIGV